MSHGPLDPLIHNPQRLRVVATLAALPRGDALSVTRLQDMIRLSPGSLITCLHELGHAGYLRTAEQTGDRTAPATVALTRDGRAALDRYTCALRQLAQIAGKNDQPRPPGQRAGDADRDAAAAALCEHFAHGRLTLDEFNTRLHATLTAATHGELTEATRDLPNLMAPAARAAMRPIRRTVRCGRWIRRVRPHTPR